MRSGFLVLVLWSLCTAAMAAAPRVVVSIKPVHSLVSGLMEGIAEPELLIDGSTTPWDYKPGRGQLELIRSADIVVWTGHELEPALGAVLSENSERSLVLEVLENEDLKVLPARDDDRRRDPFFWLDSRNMLILLDSLARVLIRVDSDHAMLYERNRQRITESIAAIDREMEFDYRDVSGVPVFFYHDTHRYFEQAYAMLVGATIAAPHDPVTTAEKTARLLTLKSQLLERDRSCLFVEQGLEQAHLDLFLTGTRVEPIELDSLGSTLDAGPGFYVELMRENFETIAGCVRRAAAPHSEITATVAQNEGVLEVPDVKQFPDKVIPRYLMRDQYGRSVTNVDFIGRFQLIYFGYTYCPDICPTSLSIMVQALKRLGELESQIQPIFITVDPKRDTPEILAEYVAYFHPRLLGLSANPAATKRIAELFKTRFQKVPAENGDPDGYTMDHTSSLFLLGRNGEFITKFAHGLPPKDVANKLLVYLGE